MRIAYAYILQQSNAYFFLLQAQSSCSLLPCKSYECEYEYTWIHWSWFRPIKITSGSLPLGTTSEVALWICDDFGSPQEYGVVHACTLWSGDGIISYPFDIHSIPRVFGIGYAFVGHIPWWVAYLVLLWSLGSDQVENLAYFMRFAQAALSKAAADMEREGAETGTFLFWNWLKCP